MGKNIQHYNKYLFRAWHKKYKKMYEILHLHKDDYNEIWATVKGFNIITQQDIHIQIQPKEIEIMQCTGLKDIKGKFIYEGDILRSDEYPFSNGEDKDNYFAVVYWDDDSAQFYRYTYKNMKCNKVVGRSSGNSDSLDKDEIKLFEVIGNIFENIDILKGWEDEIEL